MYTTYANGIISEEDSYYEQAERTSDIQLPPIMGAVLFATWAVICLVGFVMIFLAESPVLGVVIVGVPTFLGMVIKPTFALCILMLVLPTGSGVAYREIFSLDRGVGLAVAVSFLLNIAITRPRVRIKNRAFWVMGVYTVWIFLMSFASPYLSLELRRGFTQMQLLVLILTVYLILETNQRKSFIWALRCYVVGCIGMLVLAVFTGMAVRAVEESADPRYAVTLGKAIDANMLATLTGMAFLASLYLFVRDRNIVWRLFYFVSLAFLPIMLLWMGSRGALIALAFTMLLPLVFVRQVARRPAILILVLAAIVLASLSAGLLVRRGGLERSVLERLTDIEYAKQSIAYRMVPVKGAMTAVLRMPAGTGYYTWFERSGIWMWPHNDFFLALGIYGIPGAALFALFMVMIILTVKRIRLGAEKLYARAVLTFLIVMGLNIGQLFHKYFWIFLAFIIASERMSELFLPASEQEVGIEYDESLLPEYELT